MSAFLWSRSLSRVPTTIIQNSCLGPFQNTQVFKAPKIPEVQLLITNSLGKCLPFSPCPSPPLTLKHSKPKVDRQVSLYSSLQGKFFLLPLYCLRKYLLVILALCRSLQSSYIPCAGLKHCLCLSWGLFNVCALSRRRTQMPPGGADVLLLIFGFLALGL